MREKMTTPKDQMPDEIYVYDYEDGRGLSVKECRRVGDTIYHHERIVQAKDAEIAKLKQERDLLARYIDDCTFWGDEPEPAQELARKIVRGE